MADVDPPLGQEILDVAFCVRFYDRPVMRATPCSRYIRDGEMFLHNAAASLL